MSVLEGTRIIEMSAIGPVPHAGMILADMGAEVVVVDRLRDKGQLRNAEIQRRGKKSIALDLKKPEDIDSLLSLIEKCDVLIEGFRPGVMERLGVGPEICLERNPRLVYGRMTGWGQEGPLSHAAGHDINYIALTGVLDAVGEKGRRPIPPLNLVGDFGGGSMLLVSGVLAALIRSMKTGQGQVVDAAMTDGSAQLMSIIHSLDAMGMWSTERGANMLDGGAHFYNTYQTKDGKYVAIGPIEPKFYQVLIQHLGLNPGEYDDYLDRKKWPQLKSRLESVFKTRTREEWSDLLEGTDACFAPVLDYKEAPRHHHNAARGTYLEIDGIDQPAPSPRFSLTPSSIAHPPRKIGEDTGDVIKSWLDI